MQRFLAIITFLFSTSPLYGSVYIKAEALGDEVTIFYEVTGGEHLRGVALTVALQGGVLESVSDLTYLNSEFNAYIDYYIDFGTPTELPGEGAHPLSSPDGPGVAVLPSRYFGVCMGYLDEDGDAIPGEPAPGLDRRLIGFRVSPDHESTEVKVTITGDKLRGGVIGEGFTGDAIYPHGIAAMAYVPEPAGLLTLGLAGIVRQRRRVREGGRTLP